jgi:Uma2 family endonuclease
MTPSTLEVDEGIDALADTLTLAEHLRALGDVDPELVLWTPRPGTATEADLLACGEKCVELFDGMLVRKTMGMRESTFAYLLAGWFSRWDFANAFGTFTTPDGGFRLALDIVRMPDLSFTAWASLPDDTAHLQPVGDYAPDLAVEILSVSERSGAIRRKRHEFFAAGTKLVWHVDPRAETVAVYTAPDECTTLTRTDTLDGGVVLPGFALPLAALFDAPPLHPRNRPATGA